jgi:divalent metal cation (Fe/Co/Zn/Cd) transporter
LAIESKSLLIGESAEPEIVGAIRRLLSNDERILTVNEVATLHMGPDFIVTMISVDFADSLSAEHVEAAVTELTRVVKSVDSRLQRVFIEAERSEDHGGRKNT